jgi:uncharacterized protein (DUF433 family)
LAHFGENKRSGYLAPKLAFSAPGAIIHPMKYKACHSDPEIMHGEVVFVGTRVPVRGLFDYLERGRTLDYFLECFPSVKRRQCLAVLEEAKDHACPEVALAHTS